MEKILSLWSKVRIPDFLNQIYFRPQGFFWNTAAAIIVFLLFLGLRNVFARHLYSTILRITQRTATDLDDQMVKSLERPLQNFVAALGIYLALTILPLSQAQHLWVLKVFRSYLIILIAWVLYILSGPDSVVSREVRKKFDINNILVPFLSKAIRFIVCALALMVVAVEWNYNINGLITGLGLGGLAFSLAAKDTLANMFGGMVIFLDKPFTIGDWISTPSVEGTVEDITFRSTKIRTFAHALVTVPNATLANEPITNWSRMGKRRITFHLGVTYTTSRSKLEKCVQAIRAMLEEHPGIHKETIFVYFERFNESSLDIFLYFFTNTTDWKEYLSIREDVNFKIMQILEQEGVSVAFPSRSIYIEKVDGQSEKAEK
ncbi:mechanosensitive ion channel protein [Moorella sp. E308F]|uniref:mechanosensitive ion channel family protein n=1 Tax=unclassified Neomoorella TaxID=2676739 RepID=UPI0010FFAA3C|nr:MULTISPECIES: mechanosensitive ion channel family protein [unclassified Moorella (in: firmicutes)]GEA13911.1 mechanosensitive ion channel protein [Moorella sp. E308F]GEA18717.1 mechanosensitive ion channel protein [Moorella sp. E306M]